MPEMKLLAARKSEASVLGFKLRHDKASSAEERRGRLLVVLVDGPESLSLKEASRRLGISYADAKAQLKKYRHAFQAERGYASEGRQSCPGSPSVSSEALSFHF